MTKRRTVSTSINNDQKVNKKACIKHEVQAYLIVTKNNNDLSPLELWRVNGGKYRIVARVARKWLAVPATSTLSERVLLSGYCRTVESPRSTDRKESIPLQQY